MHAGARQARDCCSGVFICAAISVLCAGGFVIFCAYGAAVLSQDSVVQPQSYMTGATQRDEWFGLPGGAVPLSLSGMDWKSRSNGGETCWPGIISFAQEAGCNITSIESRNIGPADDLFNDVICFDNVYKVGYTAATSLFARCFINAIELISSGLNAAQAAANAERAQYFDAVIAPAIAITAGSIAFLLGLAAASLYLPCMPRACFSDRGGQEGQPLVPPLPFINNGAPQAPEHTVIDIDF